MKKLISRRNFLAAMGTMAAAGVLTACGGSSSGTASSAAASSTAASAAESWGDVKLTMWGAEEDQTMLREMADAFIEQNADKGNVTIEIGVQSESSAKDTVLADPESAADVFAFADDQLNELVNAGALHAGSTAEPGRREEPQPARLCECCHHERQALRLPHDRRQRLLPVL